MPLEKVKSYNSEEEYQAHQKVKTSDPKVRNRMARKHESRVGTFKARFEYALNYNFIKPKQKALCLGARLGEEVEALQLLGLDAIGIDLVPNPPLVIEGDFQNLTYEDNTFDVIYTNSSDHAFDMDVFISETYRVLKHKGHFIYDIMPGSNNISSYEVYKLDTADIIYKLCSEYNFELLSVNGKLNRLYRRKHSKTVQMIFRKGTKDV